MRILEANDIALQLLLQQRYAPKYILGLRLCHVEVIV